MAEATFNIKVGDTKPVLQATLKDGAGNAVNLTGTTVKFSMRDVQSTTIKRDKGTVVLTDAANGIVTYSWVTADTDTVGTYLGEFEVTDGSSDVETYPNSEENRLFITIIPEIS